MAASRREKSRCLPVTLGHLLGIGAAGLATRSVNGRLHPHWLERLGFAAADLWLGRLERLLTSALVTHGDGVFWEALGMTAVSLGLAEWLAGWRRALATFWGVHLATLLFESWLLASPLGRWFGAEAHDLAEGRDVGPSAGYFGSLGLAAGRLPGRWRWIGGVAGLGVLAAALFLPPRSGESRAVKRFADLAHLLAFPLGWASASFGKPGRRGQR